MHPLANRSFKFGDGFFETMVVRNQQISFLDYHFERVLRSFSVLQLERPENFSKKWIYELVIKELNLIENAGTSTWRVRITFWRKGSGLYTPLQNEVDFIVETSKLNAESYLLNDKGLRLGVCENLRISPDILSPIKSNSALHYVMAAIYKEKMQLDDCILLNSSGNIAEAVSSNIFLLKSDKLYTVPLSEGCIDGVCRRVIISIAQKNAFEVIEKPLSINDLHNSDEVWLTNVVHGIRWVNEFVLFPERKYRAERAILFTDLLNKQLNQ